MHFQEIGDAGEHVGPGAPQVDVPIAVAIAGKGAHAARHELWRPHGAGVRAGDHQRVHAVFAREQQELFELGAEIRGAGRVVEGQCGKGVQHAVFARDGAVKGLHAHDADDDFRRDAAFGSDAFQGLAIGLPERYALADAAVGDEPRPVFEPRLRLFGRPIHRFDDGGLRSG